MQLKRESWITCWPIASGCAVSSTTTPAMSLPHVQAARKLKNPGRSVSYLITLNGPEPLTQVVSPIDYEHYIERQLAPVADGILHFVDDSFERITADQMRLF